MVPTNVSRALAVRYRPEVQSSENSTGLANCNGSLIGLQLMKAAAWELSWHCNLWHWDPPVHDAWTVHVAWFQDDVSKTHVSHDTQAIRDNVSYDPGSEVICHQLSHSSIQKYFNVNSSSRGREHSRPEYWDMSQLGIIFEDSLSNSKVKLCIEGEREALCENYFNLKNLQIWDIVCYRTPNFTQCL